MCGWLLCTLQYFKYLGNHYKRQGQDNLGEINLQLCEIFATLEFKNGKGCQALLIHLYVNSPLFNKDASQSINKVSFVWYIVPISCEITSAIKVNAPFQSVASPSPAVLICCTSPQQTPGPFHSRHCLE